MNFELTTPQRIVFGSGRLRELPDFIKHLGKRCAFITGASAQRIMPVFSVLKQNGCNPAAFSFSCEPTIERVIAIANQAKACGCDYVVALGGGSVIDAGKAIAALLTNPGDLMDYLEVIGSGKPLTEKPVPCVAIPTTAGTGAEATRNAVLLATEHKVKVSMRDRYLLPSIALIDPELTRTLPPDLTAATGFDALTQLIESFTCVGANPITDSLCREGLAHVAKALPRVYKDGDDMAARESMALASLLSGITLTNAGLGAVHGLAGPIGGLFSAPHGFVCASLLPAVYAANLNALQTRDPKNAALHKFNEIAHIFTGQDEPEAGLHWLRNLATEMKIPGLGHFGITPDDFDTIIQKAEKSSSIRGNTILFTKDELTTILTAALPPPNSTPN